MKIVGNVTVQLVFLKHINSMNKELFDSSFQKELTRFFREVVVAQFCFQQLFFMKFVLHCY